FRDPKRLGHFPTTGDNLFSFHSVSFIVVVNLTVCTLVIHSQGENESGITQPWIKPVGGEIDVASTEAEERAAPDIKVAPERFGPVEHEPEAKPINRGVAKLRPRVKEIPGVCAEVKEILALGKKLDCAAAKRDRIARCHAGGIAESEAKHW